MDKLTLLADLYFFWCLEKHANTIMLVFVIALFLIYLLDKAIGYPLTNMISFRSIAWRTHILRYKLLLVNRFVNP